MSYVKGDRVRMRSNPAQVGTVTGERDQMFVSFVGVQWDHEDFGFVAPSNIELDAPVAIPGLTETERALLAEAHHRALDAVSSIVGQSKPSPDGKELTDWQTRAERAEAKVKAMSKVAHQNMLTKPAITAVRVALDGMARDILAAREGMLDADQ